MAIRQTAQTGSQRQRWLEWSIGIGHECDHVAKSPAYALGQSVFQFLFLEHPSLFYLFHSSFTSYFHIIRPWASPSLSHTFSLFFISLPWIVVWKGTEEGWASVLGIQYESGRGGYR